MKFLLAGTPKSGKTTLLEKLISDIYPKRGMIAVELLKDGQRIGFDLRDSKGNEASLARIDKKTDYPVGRYFVDITSLDTFIEPLFNFKAEDLLFIDEIGRMQLYSTDFQNLVTIYLNSANDYIGTISSTYEHPFIDEVKSRNDALFCMVTSSNRDELRIALGMMLKNRLLFNRLAPKQQQTILALAQRYLQNDRYISLKKLFGNAIRYIDGGRIKKQSDSEFIVQGDHDDRHVRKDGDSLSCDCDLFNGRGQFEDKASECSHSQTVKIYLAAPR